MSTYARYEDYARGVAEGRRQAGEAIRAHAERHAPLDGNDAQRTLRRHLEVAAGPMTHEEIAEALRRGDFAARRLDAAVVELAARFADWDVDHHQEPTDPGPYEQAADAAGLVESVRMANRMRATIAGMHRRPATDPAPVPAEPLGEVWDAPVRVWTHDGTTTNITAVTVHGGLYLDTYGGPPSYELPRHNFGTQVIARAQVAGQPDAFAVFWRRDRDGDWRQVTGDLSEADMVAWDGQEQRRPDGAPRGVGAELAAWLDQVTADLFDEPGPARQEPAPIVVKNHRPQGRPERATYTPAEESR